VLDFSLVFLLMYGPKLGFMGFDFISAASVFALVRYWRYVGSSIYTPPMLYGLLATAYVHLALTANGVLDAWWLMRMPRYLVNYLACFVVAYAVCGKASVERLVLYVFYAAGLHAGIVLLQVFSPEFDSVLAATLGNKQQSEIRFSGLVRGLAEPSLIMAASAALGYYCYVRRIIGLWHYLVIAAAIFSACLVMGRAGLYLGLTVTILAVGYDQIRRGRLLVISMAFSVTMLVLLLFVNFIDDLPFDPLVIAGLKHGVEPFINLFGKGEFSSSSMDDFENHRFVFHNVNTLQYLFGTGLYGRGDPGTYLPTDIAYAHMFSAFGLCGVALFVLATVASVGPYRPEMGRWRYIYVVQILLTVAVLSMNVKQTVLLTRHITGMVALLYGAMYYAKRYSAASSQQTLTVTTH